MENQSSDCSDTVTLALRGNHIKANRQKLANNSLYFASLFSENFKDHVQDEFTINYEISLTTLQDFVHWAHNEEEHTRVVHSPKYFCLVRASLEKFLSGKMSNLLELLELSVVFMAEKLTENLTEIVRKRLLPDNSLTVWSLAENLGLKALRDLALATCLDRFEELLLSSLLELSFDNFSKLLLNINVRSSPTHLKLVIEEWRKCNNECGDTRSFLQSKPEETEVILKNKRPQYTQCIVGHRTDDEGKETLSIYSWNNKTLTQIAEMTDAQMHTALVDNGKPIIGRQVIGRGFSIYLIGGEQGLGSGRFNMALWRYCLFFKTWNIETLLPRARRHMAVAFLKNKLYLFGGVGRHRLKLTSVDVFDVHTGTWSKAADIPESFTEVPASCVVDGKFIYGKSRMYVYDPTSDEWKIPSIYTNYLDSLMGYMDEDDNPILYCNDSGYDVEDDIQKLYLRRMNLRDCLSDAGSVENIDYWKSTDCPKTFDQQLLNGRYLVSFTYCDGRASVEVGEIGKMYRRLKTYSKEVKNVPENFFLRRLGCFNLMDPEALHKLTSLPQQEYINV